MREKLSENQFFGTDFLTDVGDAAASGGKKGVAKDFATPFSVYIIAFRSSQKALTSSSRVAQEVHRRMQLWVSSTRFM